MVQTKSHAFLRSLTAQRYHEGTSRSVESVKHHPSAAAGGTAAAEEEETLRSTNSSNNCFDAVPRLPSYVVFLLVLVVLQMHMLVFGTKQHTMGNAYLTMLAPIEARTQEFLNQQTVAKSSSNTNAETATETKETEPEAVDAKTKIITKPVEETDKAESTETREQPEEETTPGAAEELPNSVEANNEASPVENKAEMVENKEESAKALDHVVNNTAIFYNVYVKPESSLHKEATLSAVHEQLNQVHESSLRGRVVYYNLIGANVRNEELCPDPFKCERLGHYEAGWEELTLSSVQKYCLQNPDHQVLYMHNKGSFNPSKHNQRARRITTKAALADDCLRMEGCNVCASQLQLTPFIHYPANIWIAKCSYIRQLVPIQDYSSIRTEMCRHLHEFDHDAECNLTKHDLNDHKFHQTVGLGRYAMERWIVGHPTLRPCEVYPHTYLSDVRDGRGDWEPKFVQLGKLYRRQPQWIWRAIIFHLKQMYYFYGEIYPKGGFCDLLMSGLLPQNPCLSVYPDVTPLIEPDGSGS